MPGLVEAVNNAVATAERSDSGGSPSSPIVVNADGLSVVYFGSRRSYREMVESKVAKDARVSKTFPRLTHYIEESNTGRGFIKEVSFSGDGRVICSPFGYGFRLLGFDSRCSDLSDIAPREGDPAVELYEVRKTSFFSFL